MANRDAIVHLFPSTKWEYRKVKLSSGTAPAGDSASATSTSRSARRRDSHKPMTIEIRYRGGPEASWLIAYRGVVRRFAGHQALHDVLSYLSEGSSDHWQR